MTETETALLKTLAGVSFKLVKMLQDHEPDNEYVWIELQFASDLLNEYSPDGMISDYVNTYVAGHTHNER